MIYLEIQLLEIGDEILSDRVFLSFEFNLKDIKFLLWEFGQNSSNFCFKEEEKLYYQLYLGLIFVYVYKN